MTAPPTNPHHEPSPGVSWDDFRAHMPVARRWAYFAHAAVAPLSGDANLALTRFADDAAENGDAFYPAWTKQIEDLRRRAAGMIGAEVEEIALVANTTAGINLVAEGFPWQPGDNVVTRADEFPANQYPWIRLADQGVEQERLATELFEKLLAGIGLDRLLDACDDRTRIIAISWVSYSHGFRHDLAELAEAAHRKSALLFVDAVQGLGVFPIDV